MFLPTLLLNLHTTLHSVFLGTEPTHLFWKLGKKEGELEWEGRVPPM